MREFQFKYYVLNYDINRKKVVQFNIFDNINVQEWTEKAVKQYLRSPNKYKYEYSSIFQKEPIYGFEALCEEIKGTISWQMWARREYEIFVGDAFETDCSKLEKWDCYKQCVKNVEMIARECIWQYKQWLKNRKELENNEV